ncbi:ArsR/SmtB family transcription factor [Roseburia hominis]|uniref:ArsR/SmtB family transcription factor n=1 Tax=Roseburia hominis TaxID=301301 RepID=UPI0026F1A05B|nr:winged helix-turn-helix transcriptional regulator [Roseburia hominis]MCI7524383.1 winged helix-turn-helix transcriptional regulator [Roseburia hominis]
MIHITSLDDGLETFKALGSDTRIQILNILLENEQMSMNQLATELNISNGALTGHIKKLEECGLINISNESAGHGNQKMCSVTQDRIIVDIKKPIDYKNVFETEIKVGQFSRHQVWPTCGIATSESVIGEFDDIRYFNHPDRFTANILWFTKGYVEYTIPNLIPSNQRITQLSISAELSSEAPGIDNNWPSDISFYINDTKIGMWTSPGDFGDVHGMFTPQWWPQNWNQYGLLKLLVINDYGTYIDGLKISDVSTLSLHLDYSSDIRLRLAVENDSEHVGGITLYGKSFGNYDQDIRVSINYAPLVVAQP